MKLLNLFLISHIIIELVLNPCNYVYIRSVCWGHL